ncbi:unnamed protein product [Closterium sp. NIES-64]|nr:unnamed protein product [Closterium sp. NIES-64]
MAAVAAANPSAAAIAPPSASAPPAAAEAGESVRQFRLERETELRVEVEWDAKLTVKLVSGTAEIFGSEIAVGQNVTFDGGEKFAVFTWHWCNLEVRGCIGISPLPLLILTLLPASTRLPPTPPSPPQAFTWHGCSLEVRGCSDISPFAPYSTPPLLASRSQLLPFSRCSPGMGADWSLEVRGSPTLPDAMYAADELGASYLPTHLAVSPPYPSPSPKPMVSYLNLHAVLNVRRVESARSLMRAQPACCFPPLPHSPFLPPRPPWVLLVGPTDSGKSTLARMLLCWAARQQWHPTYVDPDVAHSSVTVTVPPVRAPSSPLFRVLLVGPTDSGKSTLARMLLCWAARQQWHPTYVDPDVAHSSVTVTVPPVRAPSSPLFRVLLVGPTDSGKSTLARMLLCWAARQQWHPTYVDLDVAHSSVTVPGAVAATPVEAPLEASARTVEEAPLVLFYGHTNPSGSGHSSGSTAGSECEDGGGGAPGAVLRTYQPQVHTVGGEMRHLLGWAAAGIIANSMGWVDGAGYQVCVDGAGYQVCADGAGYQVCADGAGYQVCADGAGYQLLLHSIDALRANVVLVLGQERLYSMLSEHYRSKAAAATADGTPVSHAAAVEVVKLVRSGGAVSRTSKFRQRLRQAVIKAYFYGPERQFSPHSSTASWSEYTVLRVGGGPQAPQSALPIGAARVSDPLRTAPVVLSRELEHHVLAVSHAKEEKDAVTG